MMDYHTENGGFVVTLSSLSDADTSGRDTSTRKHIVQHPARPMQHNGNAFAPN